ncbi:DUF6236 family protein [Serratia marcescens]|uniref:DUF6236 family protein n=1 Tax=Serratia marcescens TaxID=615 RepID=UPI000F7DDAB4|nr:DUF6236 family protein [Serratia marcescens]MBH2890565.1 hypothetical protein [Serratia marcescens]UYY65657.1 DUF6236 family protein [Serratia marcescens]
MEKGIILTDGYHSDPDTGKYNIRNPISLEDIRFCTLFWDRIENPKSLIDLAPPEDFDVLVQEGIASRTYVQINGIGEDGGGGNWMRELILKNQLAIMDAKKNDIGIDWSLAQTSDHLSVPNSSNVKRAVCEFNLYEAIASPIGNVSIYDVLEFKNRRVDELMALRNTLDDSVFRASTNPEDINAYEREVYRLKGVLDDYNRVMSETGFQTAKRTLTSFLCASPLGAVAIAGMIPELAAFMKVINVIGLGACSVALAYKEIIVEKNIPQEHKQLAYLIHAKQELG